MRSLPGKLRPAFRVVLAGLLLPWLPGGGRAMAQGQQQPQAPVPQTPASGRVPFGQGPEAEPDPNFRHAQEEAARKRNIDRQLRMVAEANKLVQLAQELETEIDKSGNDGKGAVPVSTARKLEEIEKLAKSVRDRMKAE